RAPRATLTPCTTLFRSNALGRAERQPAFLVVLQTIAGAFHLDHPVAPFRRPELDQIGHARAVGADVLQQPLEAGAQVRRWQAVEDRKSTRLNSSHVKIS